MPPPLPADAPFVPEYAFARLLGLSYPAPPLRDYWDRAPPLPRSHPLSDFPIQWRAIPGGELSFKAQVTSGIATDTSEDVVNAWLAQLGLAANTPPSDPARRVERFEMSQSEVTEAQYSACIAAGACPANNGGRCGGRASTDPTHPPEPASLTRTARSALPQACVSWHEARAFARWAGGRLPTEVEWIHASLSGGLTERYPWGSDRPRASTAVLMTDPRSSDVRFDSAGRIVLVTAPLRVCSGITGRSRQGVCDLIGNVAEWLADDAARGEPLNAFAPENPAATRVTRGGHFKVFPDQVHPGLRTYHFAHERRPTVGFRVVRDYPLPRPR